MRERARMLEGMAWVQEQGMSSMLSMGFGRWRCGAFKKKRWERKAKGAVRMIG